MRSKTLLVVALLLSVTLAVGLLQDGPGGSAPERGMEGTVSPAVRPHPPTPFEAGEPPPAPGDPVEADPLGATGSGRARVEVGTGSSADFRLGATVVVRRRVDERWEFEAGLDGRLVLRATPAGASGAATPRELEVAVESGRIEARFDLAPEVAAATVDVLEGRLDGGPVYGLTEALRLERGRPEGAWRIVVGRGGTATLRVVDRDTGEPVDGALVVRGEGGIAGPFDRHPGLGAVLPIAGPERSPLEVPTTWSVARGAELAGARGFLVGAEGRAWEWIPSLVVLRSVSDALAAAGGDGLDPEPRTVALGPGGALRVVVEDPSERGLPLVLHVHDDPDLSGPPVIQHPFEGALDALFEGVPIGDLRVRIGDGRRWRKTPPVDEVEVRSGSGETVEARLAVPEVDPADLRAFDARIVLRSSGWPADWTFDELGLRLVEGGDGSFGYARLEFGPRTDLGGGEFEVASQRLRLGAGRYGLAGPRLGRRRELTIDQPGDQVVELGPPCSLRVDLVDGATGAPLPELALYVGARPFGGRIQLVGTKEYLRQAGGGFVLASGTEAGRYADAPASFHVWGAAGPTELRVQLPLGAERVDPDGVRWIPGLYAERTVELTPASDRLVLRVHRGLALVVRLKVDGRGLGFPLSRPLDDVVILDGPGSVVRAERWGDAAVLRVDRAGDYSLRLEPADGYLAPDPIPVSIIADQPVELEVALTRDG